MRMTRVNKKDYIIIAITSLMLITGIGTSMLTRIENPITIFIPFIVMICSMIILIRIINYFGEQAMNFDTVYYLFLGFAGLLIFLIGRVLDNNVMYSAGIVLIVSLFFLIAIDIISERRQST